MKFRHAIKWKSKSEYLKTLIQKKKSGYLSRSNSNSLEVLRNQLRSGNNFKMKSVKIKLIFYIL